MFQSHLYGIERIVYYYCSIKIIQFQSHLYGIEREDGFIYNNVCNCFNRTFMELKERGLSLHKRKPPGFNRTFMELKVTFAEWAFHQWWCFNRTFMELKGLCTVVVLPTPPCFNRTFMELKERFKILWGWRWWSFNRTFMELKVKTGYAVAVAATVSIAPLWNWKEVGDKASPDGECFNRTFMELKASCLPLKGDRLLCFNRTFMELKDALGVKITELFPRFNRTFMELKDLCIGQVSNLRAFQSHLYGIESQHRLPFSGHQHVSIAPLWNWKLEISCKPLRYSCFNRTFMELKVIRHHTEDAVFIKFQSHLYGIESCLYKREAQLHRVSIAPLWNWKSNWRHTWISPSRVSIAPLWNWKGVTFLTVP